MGVGLRNYLFHNPLGSQAGGDEHGWHPGAGMRAGSNEVQVMVTAVPVMRTQVGHLGQFVTEPVRGAARQVVTVPPVAGVKVHLSPDVRFHVWQAQPGQALEDELAGPGLQGRPILRLCVIDMADRDSHVPGVMTGGGHGWVQADGRMDVEVRFIRHAHLFEDVLETPAVIAIQEQVVRPELRILLVQAPVEHDGRAAVLHAVDAVGRGRIREQVPVDIPQVRVRHDSTGRKDLATLQADAGGASAVDQDLFHRGVVQETHPELFGDGGQGLDEAVHAAHGVPQPFPQFGVLHQRVSGRGLVRAEAHVHILEGEGHLQARVFKEAADIAGVAGECLHLQEEQEHARIDKIGQTAEVPADHPGEGPFVNTAAFCKVTQQALEAAGLEGLQLCQHVVQVGGQLQLQVVLKIQMVGGVDTAQVQVVLHAFTQGGEGLGIDFGHQEEGRAGIEGVPVDGHAADAPAGLFAFLQHGHLAALARQAGGGGDPADAGTHDQDLRLACVDLHEFILVAKQACQTSLEGRQAGFSGGCKRPDYTGTTISLGIYAEITNEVRVRLLVLLTLISFAV